MSTTVASLPPCVLCFAPSDATSGGGVQSDVLTLASMGCHPLTVVCAIAPRDTRSLEEFVPLDADLVVAQARAVLEDIPVAGFRLGMAGSAENLAAIAEILSDYPDVPLVVDPALHHLDGDDEACEDFMSALVELILPQTTVLVAGERELMRIAGVLVDDEDELSGSDASERLIECGASFVLMTRRADRGPKLVNALVGPAGVIRTDTWDRLDGHHLGARATLSTALAAAMAHGMDVPEAVREAQEFTWQALAASYRPGMGLALPDRMFWVRSGDSNND